MLGEKGQGPQGKQGHRNFDAPDLDRQECHLLNQLHLLLLRECLAPAIHSNLEGEVWRTPGSQFICRAALDGLLQLSHVLPLSPYLIYSLQSPLI